MQFSGDINKVSFHPQVRPLFESMMAGETIRSITCYAGGVNKDDRTKDFTIENVKGLDYYQGMQCNFDGSQWFDYVDIKCDQERTGFYMNWVLNFTI